MLRLHPYIWFKHIRAIGCYRLQLISWSMVNRSSLNVCPPVPTEAGTASWPEPDSHTLHEACLVGGSRRNLSPVKVPAAHPKRPRASHCCAPHEWYRKRFIPTEWSRLESQVIFKLLVKTHRYVLISIRGPGPYTWVFTGTIPKPCNGLGPTSEQSLAQSMFSWCFECVLISCDLKLKPRW